MASRAIGAQNAWERLVRHYLGEPLPEVERRRLAVIVREALRLPGSEAHADVLAEREAARRIRQTDVH